MPLDPATVSLPLTSPNVPLASGITSKCTHPVGGGSYTCISFGEPKAPIFAFHTVQDSNNRVFVGTGSGFEEGFEEELRASSLNSVETIRRKRKLLAQIQEKEMERMAKERRMASRRLWPALRMHGTVVQAGSTSLRHHGSLQVNHGRAAVSHVMDMLGTILVVVTAAPTALHCEVALLKHGMVTQGGIALAGVRDVKARTMNCRRMLCIIVKVAMPAARASSGIYHQ